MTEQYTNPAYSDDLDEFLGRVHPNDIPQGSVEDLQEMMTKMKADMAKREGDT